MPLKITSKSNEPLHIRLRPQSLDEVIGQELACKALTRLDLEAAHAILLAGPPGVGKTSIARILGLRRQAEVIEIDGATRTGIEAMRELVDFVASPRLHARLTQVIVDEAHRISRQTWDSLLKIVEEPPYHLYWTFCTTDPGKVPDTIKQRCHVFDLKPVRTDDIITYLREVLESEKLNVLPDFIGIAARKADGSVRQALVYLALLDGVQDKQEALWLMQTAEERREVIDFIRDLAFKRPTWAEVQKHLSGFQEQEINAESIRLALVNYLAAAILGAKSEKDAVRLLSILSEFQTPYNSSEKYGPLLLSVAHVVFPE